MIPDKLYKLKTISRAKRNHSFCKTFLSRIKSPIPKIKIPMEILNHQMLCFFFDLKDL